jgi:ATP-dependent Clp protease ATP-binding subunit ClpC
MDELVAFTLLVAICVAIGYWLGRRSGAAARGPARALQPGGSQDEQAAPQETPQSAGASAEARGELYGLAKAMEGIYQGLAQPIDLRAVPQFVQGVIVLQTGGFTTSDLCGYAIGDNPVLSCMALEALRVRESGEPFLEALLPGINVVSHWSRWLFLDLLDARHPEPVLERLLLAINGTWDTPLTRPVLREFIARRLARGEKVRVDGRFVEDKPPPPGPFTPPSKVDFLAGLIDEIESDSARELAAALRNQVKAGRNLEALRTVGRILETDRGQAILEHPELTRALEASEQAVLRSRALLVVGRPGVGKSTLVRALGERLRARGYTVFEAGSSDLIADQSMVGQLEGRLQKLLAATLEAPVLWVVPDFAELVWAGRHRFGHTSVLDALMPHLEADRLRIVGELEPEGLDRLLRAQPRLRSAADVVRLEPPSEEETLALGRRWGAGVPGAPRIDEPTLREAADLARQYLGETSPPGNLLELLRLAVDGHSTGADQPLDGEDLIAALTRLTGLPASMLDERETLDLEGLRRLFGRRVLGQPEAVDCLVERVAMLKAGLVDPGRPACSCSPARPAPARRRSRARWRSSCSARRSGWCAST